jgi:hypothetical protein
VRARLWGLAVLLTIGGACRPASDRTPRSGHLDASWTGSNRGEISAPATAEWCAIRRLLEIRAIQGDTGVALALYPAETIAAGSYRIVDPVKAESIPQAAGVALRWFAQTAVDGFQGESGTVILERSRSGQLSGSVKAGARSVADTRRVAINGSFRDLTVRPESRGCVPPSENPEEDASPDADVD